MAFAQIYRLSVRLALRGSLAWAAVLGVSALSVVAGYQAAYPGAFDRRMLAASLGDNPAFRALYGPAIALDTTGGFLQWRYGAAMAVMAGLWGLLLATRLLRGEEESGRLEVLAAGALRPTRLLVAQLLAILTGFSLILVGITAGTALGGLPLGRSAFFGLQTTLVGLTFAMLGAVMAQVAVTRRKAASWAGLALALAYVIRAAADASNGLAWLGWASPLAWAQRAQPFTGPDGAPVLVAFVAAFSLAALAVAFRARRDLGATVFALADRGEPSLRMLGSPVAFTVRTNRAITAAWALGVGALALLFGLLAVDVIDFARKDVGISRLTSQLAGIRMDTADGFLGFAFAFVAVITAALAVTLVGSMREEEATGRLDNILVHPVTRTRWYGARCAVALGIVWIVVLVGGAAGYLGATARGAEVSLSGILTASANCVPVTVFFGGIALVAFALVPRHTVSIGLGLSVGLFLVNFVGVIVKAPEWLLDLSPYHHVAPAPAMAVNRGGAALLFGVGLVLALAAGAAFARRDLQPE